MGWFAWIVEPVGMPRFLVFVFIFGLAVEVLNLLTMGYKAWRELCDLRAWERERAGGGEREGSGEGKD